MVRRLLAVCLIVMPIAIAVGSPQPAQASPAAVPANPPPTPLRCRLTGWHICTVRRLRLVARAPQPSMCQSPMGRDRALLEGFVSGSIIWNVTSSAVSSGTYRALYRL